MSCIPHRLAISPLLLAVLAAPRKNVRAITVPTLIIHGANDQNAPLDMFGRPLAEALVGSQFKIYEDAAHGLFLTHQKRLVKDLLAFIQN